MKRFWQKPTIKKYTSLVILVFVLKAYPSPNVNPDTQNFSDLVAGLAGIKVSGEWYLTYENGENDQKHFNEFAVQRGYINIQKTFNSNVAARMTPNISVDREGDGIGDLKMRLKYCYLKYGFKSIGLLTKPYFEFGLIHRPLLDFEQKINPYRVQGHMYLERVGIVNSGDYGLLFVSLLGGEIKENYKKNVNKNFPGKFGSIAIGIYNGGGYHAIEENTNKTVEARLSLRPWPQFIPGLQISYNGIIGKGNTELAPDWDLSSGFVTYENSFLVLSGTYFQGSGNYKGKAINKSGQSLDQEGYSFFCDYTLPLQKISIFGRYDFFDNNINIKDPKLERKIIGFTYHLVDGCKFLIDYDFAQYENSSAVKDSKIQTAIEVKF
jgi:hypothetical protein